MFQAIQTRLASVKRFDLAANTKQIQVGEIETPSGGTTLALQVPSPSGDQTLTLEPHGQTQLLQNWKVPTDHFARLPRELQAAELNHFFHTAPKDLTVRAVQNGAPTPAARSFMSGKYEVFDSAEAIEVAETTLHGVGNGEWQIAVDNVERDEMRLLLVQPQEHDVSARKIGDMVKLGLEITNSEIGTGALKTAFSTFRLACLNGMSIPEAAVTVRQAHIYINKASFRIQLKNAIQNVTEIGMTIIAQMRASHDLKIGSLDPDGDKLQKQVHGILRRYNMATKEFIDRANATLGREEEASLFGLAQFVTGAWAKSRTTVMDRVYVERVGGALMALAS